ncbi:hypothetical protein [Tenacibaculum singaporense]|uniref:hypothetical protein n=1 Tax=Tenacibaculum singaporense TaxID=2358479 RepID=UPI000F66C963|nr:hypothetical protein [Tenacibaculum singaporense]RSC93491.1 hypothetical protein EI424_09785 [Tenacibaculum singaporense]
MNKTKTILIATLLVGTLDGLAAIIQFLINGGSDISKVFQFIASGVFGKTAFSGGTTMALYGVVFHYLIALVWVVLFFLLYPKIIKKSLNKYLVGTVYGILIWLAMNKVVLPLSYTPNLEKTIMQDVVAALILIVFVGIPTAVMYTVVKPNQTKITD